jgi:hydrogenase nickel incorporation protein HypA/HybF
VGPLACVVKESLLPAFEMAIEGTPLAGSRLIIEEVPVIVYCEQCRVERQLPTMLDFSCPVCRTPAAEVRHGEELQVTALEVETGPAGQVRA